MKNVTIALDDETHRRARICAAEMGTSLSALVKDYLQSLGDDLATGSIPRPPTQAIESKVREMPLPYHPQPATRTNGAAFLGSAVAVASSKGPEGQPYFVNGKWVFTKDGKPRKPGAMRHLAAWTEDFDSWPEGFLESLEAWPYGDPGFDPLPFDNSQLAHK